MFACSLSEAVWQGNNGSKRQNQDHFFDHLRRMAGYSTRMIEKGDRLGRLQPISFMAG
jgi:hypothetical protein